MTIKSRGEFIPLLQVKSKTSEERQRELQLKHKKMSNKQKELNKIILESKGWK
jgi:hypothetical protein